MGPTASPTSSPTASLWFPILQCNGNWQTRNRTLNKNIWQKAKTLRICLEINGDDKCVTTSCSSILNGLTRNPPTINQKSGVCDPRPNELFYHACGNPKGIHISLADNGLCGRFVQGSGPVTIQIQT